MSEPAPPPPRLGPADDHRDAAENAALRRDFDTALRERFRAVLRGLEQRGMLEVRRSRTARETADDASTALPLESASELHPAAHSFDEVVYGGRRATEDEYRRLEYADRYSRSAPPPAPEPVEATITEQTKPRRQLPPLPDLLRNPKFWAALLATIALVVLLYAVTRSCAVNPPHKPQTPDIPPPTKRPDPPDNRDDSGFGAGDDSLFSSHPALAFGGLQFLIAAALVVWWRARRRGALVGEPRPVEVAANELLGGQAALYRRSKDHEHVAARLRAATLRRIRPMLGVSTDATPDRLIAAVAARTRADPAMVGAALYGPVPDAGTLQLVATQLEWIEAEVG